MNNINLLFSFLFFLTFGNVMAQGPAPGPTQDKAILILGGTAHIGDGSVIENAAIAFENGKITMVADASKAKVDRSAYGQIFDATGKHIYPGFIAMNTLLGLVEVNAVRSSRDFEESGSMNPNVRALIAYNTDSDVTPTVRSNGVLMAQICPEGGRLSGTSAAVQLDAWNWEDANLREDGVHLNWPSTQKWTGWEIGRPRKVKDESYGKKVDELKAFFQEAKAYCNGQAAAKNLKFEALRPVFSKNRKLYIHTDQALTMQAAVLFAEDLEVSPVLVGANDAWMITDFLKDHDVPVVLNSTQRLPTRSDEPVYQPYETPKVLHEAGVSFVITDAGHWRQRNLPFQVGQAVCFGLDYEAAIQSVTLTPAKIMGLEKNVGSLELSKDATLFISEGDVLDMKESQVIAAFVQGRTMNLTDKHKELYIKFKNKYEAKKK